MNHEFSNRARFGNEEWVSNNRFGDYRHGLKTKKQVGISEQNFQSQVRKQQLISNN
jgi:hypothetical protein